MSVRLAKMGCAKYDTDFSQIRVHSLDVFSEPLFWKKPQRIFVCSMSDLFHEDVSDGTRFDVFSTIKKCPDHTFQILTKRAERMRDFFKTNRWCIYPNVWTGVTVCNASEADTKIPALLETPSYCRFVSMEPLLTEVSIKTLVPYLDWVIIGAETGKSARYMNPDWARAIQIECREKNVPFFIKKMSGNKPVPADLYQRDFPSFDRSDCKCKDGFTQNIDRESALMLVRKHLLIAHV